MYKHRFQVIILLLFQHVVKECTCSFSIGDSRYKFPEVEGFDYHAGHRESPALKVVPEDLKMCSCGGTTMDVRSKFTDGYEYNSSQRELYVARAQAPESLLDGEFKITTTPEFFNKSTYESLFDMCRETPRRTGDLKASTFHSMLKIIGHLRMKEPEKRRILFRNVAIKGLLGANVLEIIQPHGEDKGKDAEQHKDARENIYLELLNGFASTADMEVKVIGDKAMICPTGGAFASRRSIEDLRFTGPITKVEILSSTKSIIRHENVWLILEWLFSHMGVSSLTLVALKLSVQDMEKMACLGVEEITLRLQCLSKGCLSALAKNDTLLRSKLRRLDLSFNTEIDFEDMVALSTMQLSVLDISYCYLPGGYLVPLGSEDSELRRTLCSLNTSHNILGPSDMDAISCFEVLTDLDISACRTAENSLSLLASRGSPLENVLEKLNISDNKLQTQELAMMSRLKLKVLEMANCRCPSRGLLTLFAEDTVLKETLERLDVAHNYLFVSEDIDKITEISLKVLNMHNCGLSAGSLIRFGECSSVIRCSLRTLEVSCNRISAEDMIGLSALELEKLDVSSCCLEKGSLMDLLKHSPYLKNTLQWLNASTNKLGTEDMETVSETRLKEVYLNGCLLPLGSIDVLLGKKASPLRTSLWRMDASANMIGYPDTTAIAFTNLKELILARCCLPRDSLEPLLAETSTVRRTLQKVNILYNYELTEASVLALSKLESIQEFFS